MSSHSRPEDRRYEIARSEVDGSVDVTVVANGDTYSLRPVLVHGEAFNYGYGGSGPADLALSILADLFDEHPTRRDAGTGDYRCWTLHKRVKARFITQLNPHVRKHTLCAREVLDFVERTERRAAQLNDERTDRRIAGLNLEDLHGRPRG
jgi:hypothetical protein